MIHGTDGLGWQVELKNIHPWNCRVLMGMLSLTMVAGMEIDMTLMQESVSQQLEHIIPNDIAIP